MGEPDTDSTGQGEWWRTKRRFRSEPTQRCAGAGQLLEARDDHPENELVYGSDSGVPYGGSYLRRRGKGGGALSTYVAKEYEAALKDRRTCRTGAQRAFNRTWRRSQTQGRRRGDGGFRIGTRETGETDLSLSSGNYTRVRELRRPRAGRSCCFVRPPQDESQGGTKETREQAPNTGRISSVPPCAENPGERQKRLSVSEGKKMGDPGEDPARKEDRGLLQNHEEDKKSSTLAQEKAPEEEKMRSNQGPVKFYETLGKKSANQSEKYNSRYFEKEVGESPHLRENAQTSRWKDRGFWALKLGKSGDQSSIAGPPYREKAARVEHELKQTSSLRWSKERRDGGRPGAKPIGIKTAQPP